MLRRITSTAGPRTFGIAGALAVALILAVALWPRTDKPSQTASPAQPSATAVPPVSLASLTVPDGCRLFDRGYWDAPVEAGVAETIRLTAASCAVATLDAVAQSGRGIEVTWTVPALPSASLMARSVLTSSYDPTTTAERNWTGTVTFSEPGQWISNPILGGGAFFDVTAGNNGLVQRSPNLPLPVAPQTVAVLDGGATKVVRTFPTERGGTGMLRGPDRAVFVQARDGGRWLVTGDIATGALTPLFEVGPFTNIISAPDGRAIAVEWGRPNGRRELRIVTAAGSVTTIDDSTINPIVVEWAPDSNTLIAEGDSRWVLGADGTVRDRRPSDDLQGPQTAWSPDSTYALLWYSGQPGRLVQLDRATLNEQAILTDANAAISGFAIADDGKRIAFGWRDPSQGSSYISVLTPDELTRVRLADRVVATFDPTARFSPDPGALNWSPDGRLIAFNGFRMPNDGSGQPAGSEIAVLNVSTGEVRQVAEATNYYSGQSRLRAWSADGSTFFALRYNCQGCEPSKSSVDVIDVVAGRVVDTFEDSGYYGPTAGRASQLLSTPKGLLRTDGRAPGEVLVPFAGGLFFGWPVVSLPASAGGGSLIAVQVGVGRGQQIFAARPDGTAVDLLAVLGLGEAPFALLDETAAIVRGDRQWERRTLAGGATTPYVASSGALEKFDLAPSHTRRRALDLDREGFAVLDLTMPAAPAVVARRAYPGGTPGQPAWSADERHVAFGDGYAVSLFDIESRAERVFPLDAMGVGLVRDESLDRLWALTWTPRGSVEFATARALWRLDVDTGKAVKVIDAPRPGGFTQGAVLTYSPDGRTLAAATQYGVFALTEGGNWKQLSAVGVSPAGGPRQALYWAPDSSAVAYAGASSHVPEGIIVAPLDGRGAYRLVAPGSGNVLGWLHDGRLLWVSATGGI